MGYVRLFLVATQFLTRLPIPARLQSQWTMAHLRDSVPMFPVVGLFIGLGASLVYAVAVFCNLPSVLAAVLTVAAQVLATGALHEDGFADVCDGFGGGHTRERKLEIMRDSRLGTYGAIGLMLGLALRIGAIGAIAHPEAVAAGLVAAAVLSRAAMPVAMGLFPQARAEGLAAAAGKPGSGRVVLGAGIAAIICALCLSLPVAAAIVLAAIAVATGFLRLARQQIGGITGDVLGGLQQLLEITCLLTLLGLSSLA